MDKIIYFKAMMPKTSGYKIADTFNRQFSHLDTVSKTYVYNIIRKHHYAILIERKNIKNKKPHSVDINWVWPIDLTGKHDSNKCNQHILAIIDHGSRFNITLKYIDDKSSKRLLFEIYHAVKKTVSCNGHALKYIPLHLKNKYTCLTAVMSTGESIEYVPKDILDRDICLEALKTDISAFRKIPAKLKDEEMCRFLFKDNPWILRYMPKKVQAILKQETSSQI